MTAHDANIRIARRRSFAVRNLIFRWGLSPKVSLQRFPSQGHSAAALRQHEEGDDPKVEYTASSLDAQRARIISHTSSATPVQSAASFSAC